jgi:hypothetical protein
MKGTDYISPSERLSVWGWWEEIEMWVEKLISAFADNDCA